MKTLPRKSTALFLSLLVFPGAGHIYWGEKKKGYLLIVLILVELAVPFIFFEKELVHQINLLPNPLLAFSHSWDLIKKVWELQKIPLLVSGVALVLTWIGATVDLVLEKNGFETKENPR